MHSKEIKDLWGKNYEDVKHYISKDGYLYKNHILLFDIDFSDKSRFIFEDDCYIPFIKNLSVVENKKYRLFLITYENGLKKKEFISENINLSYILKITNNSLPYYHLNKDYFLDEKLIDENKKDHYMLSDW